jgi:uncharacterized protein
MTNEERDIISQFVARVGGAPSPAPAGFASGGSVPATQAAPPLPPVDQDADALIRQMFQRYPEATYRMTQLAFVQEQGLIQAQNRIHQLEAELEQTRQAMQQQQQQSAQPASGGGFFSNLFGGGQSRQAPPPPPQGVWGGGQPSAPPPRYAPPPQYAPPPPQYAPGYQHGMFQRSGSGFLGSALTTAAGVAGGMVVGHMLTDMFTGGSHGGGWAGPAAGAMGGPWESPQAPDQSAWGAGGASDQNFVDSGSWDQSPATDPSQDASWTDNSGGGWDSGSGGGDSWDSGGGDSMDSGDSGGSDDTF